MKFVIRSVGRFRKMFQVNRYEHVKIIGVDWNFFWTRYVSREKFGIGVECIFHRHGSRADSATAVCFLKLFIWNWPFLVAYCEVFTACISACLFLYAPNVSLINETRITTLILQIYSSGSKVKVKWSRYRPAVAQRVGRGIALLFHDRGTRRGWVVSSTAWPHFTPGKDSVPILQEAGWAPGPVWTGGKSRPHQDSIPDRPSRSQSLYRLSYRPTFFRLHWS